MILVNLIFLMVFIIIYIYGYISICKEERKIKERSRLLTSDIMDIIEKDKDKEKYK